MTYKEFFQGFGCFIGFILIVIIGGKVFGYYDMKDKLYNEEQNTSIIIEYCNIEDNIYCINGELMYKKELYSLPGNYIIFSPANDIKKLACDCKK